MKAVILAAGEGTRLNKGWTIVLKPLLEVGDKTIIEYVIEGLSDAGIKDIIIVVGFMSEHIKDYLRDGVDYGVKIEYIYNEKYKGDIAMSVAMAKGHVQGPFILCMADLFFESAIISDLMEKSKEGMNYVCADKKLKQVRRIEEKVKVKLNGENVEKISMNLADYEAIDCGIYLLQETIFPAIEESINQNGEILPRAIEKIANQGKFKIHDIESHNVIDMDREKDAEFVLSEVQDGKR